MKLEQIAIYDSIEGYMEQIPVIKVKKGEYITKRRSSRDGTPNKYYILNGQIRVWNNVGSRKIWVDEIGEDWFAGDLSDVYEEYLNCESWAVKDTMLLEFNDEIFEKLLNDVRFAKAFYYKMSQRVYHMYKRMLMNSMYSQKEILSSYILSNSKKDRMVCPNMNALCEFLGFSRRSLYNTLNDLIKDGILEKDDNYIYIKDKEALEDQGKHVIEYML